MTAKPIQRLLAAALTTALPTSAAHAAPATRATPLPAFPGAQGAGSTTPGGRGCPVYEVTTLADSGPGSLRDAVSQSSRTIVFRVAGTIDLRSPLDVRANNLTLAGQTAPSGGICLRNYTLNLRGRDLVVRHLRARLGDSAGQQSDSITLWHGSRNVVIDHCSATWSVDESLSLAGDVADVTVQWCLIGESLRHSIHAKGNHGYGSLSRATGPITWHHNLWIHNDSRNPRLGDNYGKGNHPTFDVRNNVVYDFGQTCTGLTQGTFDVNYVGNYLRPGPSSKAKQPITIGGPSHLAFYLADNLFEPDDSLAANPTHYFSRSEIDGQPQLITVDKPFPMPPVRTTPAKQAYEEVLTRVGATLPTRDPVDTRLIDHVRTRTGRMIDSPKDVGGYPDLSSPFATPPADSDHDGMPDTWETQHKLDPTNPADATADPDADGYTNLEEFLNHTDPHQFIDYSNPANNVDKLPIPVGHE